MTPLRLYVPPERVKDLLAYRWQKAVMLATYAGWNDQPKPGYVELVAVAAIRNPTEDRQERGVDRCGITRTI